MPPRKHPENAVYIVFCVCWAYFAQYLLTTDASSKHTPKCTLYSFFRVLSIRSATLSDSRCLLRNIAKSILYCFFRMLSILSPMFFESRCLLEKTPKSIVDYPWNCGVSGNIVEYWQISWNTVEYQVIMVCLGRSLRILEYHGISRNIMEYSGI